RLRRDYFEEDWALAARNKAHRKSRDPEADQPRREKIAAAKLGKKRPPHVGRAVSGALRGRPLSDDHRRKLSKAQRRRGARPPKPDSPGQRRKNRFWVRCRMRRLLGSPGGRFKRSGPGGSGFGFPPGATKVRR